MLASSSSQWHSISPQTRPLALTILELTPLAVTLSLSLAFPTSSHSHHTPHTHLAHSHNHTHGSITKHRKRTRHKRAGLEAESDEDIADFEDETTTGSSALTHFADGSSFKDLLSHGVVVSVNGQPWTRIVAHVSDPDEDEAAGQEEDDGEWEDTELEEAVEAGGIEEGLPNGVTRRRPRRARFSLSAGNAVQGEKEVKPRKKVEGLKDRSDKDRAVVVVYGLSPGKEYEIELRVVGLSDQDGFESLGESLRGIVLRFSIEQCAYSPITLRWLTSTLESQLAALTIEAEV
jgi:hypothetical protein